MISSVEKPDCSIFHHIPCYKYYVTIVSNALNSFYTSQLFPNNLGRLLRKSSSLCLRVILFSSVTSLWNVFSSCGLIALNTGWDSLGLSKHSQVFSQKSQHSCKCSKICEWALYALQKLFLRHWSSDFTNERTPLSIFLKCPLWFLYKINSTDNSPSLPALSVCQGHVEVYSENVMQAFKVQSQSCSICTYKDPYLATYWLHINANVFRDVLCGFAVEHLY